MRATLTALAVTFTLTVTSAAAAHSMLPRHKPFGAMTLTQLRDYQLLTLRRDANTIHWWRSYTHPRASLASAIAFKLPSYPRCLGARMPRAVCWHYRHRAWTRPLLRRTLARLAQASRPAHYALWLCIHNGEGAWTAATGNGFYGGLQMTYGWGGAARADTLSPLEQMRLAERQYAASGYSRSWLGGQWPNTSPPCLGYA